MESISEHTYSSVAGAGLYVEGGGALFEFHEQAARRMEIQGRRSRSAEETEEASVQVFLHPFPWNQASLSFSASIEQPAKVASREQLSNACVADSDIYSDKDAGSVQTTQCDATNNDLLSVEREAVRHVIKHQQAEVRSENCDSLRGTPTAGTVHFGSSEADAEMVKTRVIKRAMSGHDSVHAFFPMALSIDVGDKLPEKPFSARDSGKPSHQRRAAATANYVATSTSFSTVAAQACIASGMVLTYHFSKWGEKHMLKVYRAGPALLLLSPSDATVKDRIAAYKYRFPSAMDWIGDGAIKAT